MNRCSRPSTLRSTALILVGVLALGACGDDGSSTSTPGDGASDSTDAPSIEGSVGDDLLLVPRSYLQGEWCDSDGQTWTIAGDTATFVDSSGGTAQFPVDLAFLETVDTTLVSQTDDEFVVSGFNGTDTTFSRGAC